MIRRRILKFGLLAGAVTILAGAVGGIAYAKGHGGMCGMRQAYMKKMVTQRIDDALDYAKVEGPAKDKIHDIRDKLFTQFESQKGNRLEHMKKVKELFLADKLDKKDLDDVRAEHQQRFEKMADLIEESFLEAHDALTAEQRAKVIEYVEKHHPGHFEEE